MVSPDNNKNDQTDKKYNQQVYFLLFTVIVLVVVIIAVTLQLNNKTALTQQTRAAAGSSAVCRSSFTVLEAPSPTSTTAPTPTSTPTPPVLSCTNWAIDENSGTDSQLVKINELLTSLSLVNTYLCKDGICDFESLEIHPGTKVLYAAPRTTRSLYTINTNPDDSVEDGTLSLIAKLSPEIRVNALSFRKSDNSLWAWANDTGLFTINISDGTATKVFSSTLDNVEGITWDKNSQYLYASRTPSKSPKYANYELHRYDPGTNSLAYYASLPGDTDSLDYRSADDLLIGAYGISGGVRFYAYDVISKTVKANYDISTSYKNIDALTICN